MGKWSTRIGLSAVIATGAMGFSAVASFGAAPGATVVADDHNLTATALSVPGVVTVSQASVPDNASPHWTGLSAAGVEVIGKDENGATGVTAAGGVLDALNNALCPDPIVIQPGTTLNVCLQALAGHVTTHQNEPYDENSAYGEVALASVGLTNGTSAYGVGALVAPADADSTTYSGCRYRNGEAGLLTVFASNTPSQDVGYADGTSSTC